MNLKTEEWQQTVYARIQSQLKSLGRLTPDLLQKTKTVTAVMNTYKVSLENMLCDTDIKEQVHFRGRNISILRSLDTIMLTSRAPHSLIFPCKEGAGRSTYLCPCPLYLVNRFFNFKFF